MMTLHQPLVREEDAQREFWQQYMASEQSLQKKQFEKPSLDGGRVPGHRVRMRSQSRGDGNPVLLEGTWREHEGRAMFGV